MTDLRKSDAQLDTCRVGIEDPRGMWWGWWACGRPAKGKRVMTYGVDKVQKVFPACGIHMRMKRTPHAWKFSL